MKRKAKKQTERRVRGLPADAREVYSDGLATFYIANDGSVFVARKETVVYRVLKGVGGGLS